MRSTQLTGRLLALIGALALLAAACGDDSATFANQFGDETPLTGDTGQGTDDAPPDDTLGGVDRSAEVAGRWEITNYTLNSGPITNVLGEGAHLTFGPDGTLTYGTGCNEGSGSYDISGVYVMPTSALDPVIEGQPITIGPDLAQTEIGCEGFLGEQDVDIPARLLEANRFILRDGMLVLLDDFILIEASRPS